MRTGVSMQKELRWQVRRGNDLMPSSVKCILLTCINNNPTPK